MAHNWPSDAAWMVAALQVTDENMKNIRDLVVRSFGGCEIQPYLGILYNKANSPKLPLLSYVWICFISSPTNALNLPLEREK